MLDGLPSSSEKPLPLGMGYVTNQDNTNTLRDLAPICQFKTGFLAKTKNKNFKE